MSPDEIATQATAAALRESFDRAFAEPPRPVSLAMEGFLAVRSGSSPYAIRLSEIASVHRAHTLTPFPGADPWLLGMAGFRGTPAPVYDLRAALGHAGGPVPRWLVLVRAPSLVGFAFDHLDAQFRVAAAEITPGTSREHSRPFLDGMVRSQHTTHFIIRIAAVLEAIAARLHTRHTTEEAES